MAYYFLNEDLYFPPVHKADEYGILAIGGDLSTERLLLAYQSGIFPWYSQEEPIIWWSPDPRFILYPTRLKISKSMKQVLKKQMFQITLDQDFREVIGSCQKIGRKGQNGTWITKEMVEAYCHLHELGYAHSVEVWLGGELVGGLYGVSLGSCYFGESMFSKVSNASKAGFITLVSRLSELNFTLIDCQVHTTHLESLGAENQPREQFMQDLQEALLARTLRGSWQNLLET
ncbi:MAG: leucyl/phenylalanyl-tRNA--protein transferase [Bacteroidia bacterium]|nr:leucyl/phenylalanyl-tRNA--protein transferase [Bacteroidia bacterium]